jgi:hypothetical protein
LRIECVLYNFQIGQNNYFYFTLNKEGNCDVLSICERWYANEPWYSVAFINSLWILRGSALHLRENENEIDTYSNEIDTCSCVIVSKQLRRDPAILNSIQIWWIFISISDIDRNKRSTLSIWKIGHFYTRRNVTFCSDL